MASAGDAALIRAETEISSLELLLSPERLLDTLRKTDFANRWARLEPRYVRYKPGTRALAAFDGLGEEGPEPLYAVAHGRDSAHKARGDEDKGGEIHLRRQGLSIYRFPFDRRLRSLAKLDREDSASALLHRVLAAEATPVKWEVLAYKPERRCVVRVLADRPVVLKFFSGGTYGAARKMARSLEPYVPFGPKQVGGSKRHRVLAFEWVEGALLRDVFAEGSSRCAGALEETGRRLAELHGAALPLHALGQSASVPPIETAAVALVALLPEEKGWIERLASALGSVSARGTPQPVFCHGDFYAKQVIVEPGREIRFLDFDRAGWSDVHCDLATFWAHLERDHRCARLAAEPQDILDHLLGGYRGRAEIDARTLAGHAAAALFSLAVHPFRDRDGEWPSRIRALLDRVGQLVAEATRGREFVKAPSSSLAPALDPESAPPALARCLNLSADQVEPGVLVRHKRGRRALVRYPIRNACIAGVIGKYRAKGVDTRACSLHTEVHRTIKAEAPPTLRAPEPLGLISDLSMWLQAEVPGTPATSLLVGSEGPSVARRIADALSELHAFSVRTDRVHDAERELGLLTERLDHAAVLRRDLAPRIEELGRRLAAAVMASPEAENETGIHRDFYPDQVLVGPDHIVLLDFDLFCWGERELDVGNFIAHLEEFGLRVRNPGRSNDVVRAFREQYLIRCAGEVSRERIELYRRLSLARHIFLSTQFPDRTHTTEELLTACETTALRQGDSI